jgi:hypothetical protein
MAVTTLDQSRIQREREVENALASVRMEGLEPSAEAHGVFQRYVEGKLTLEEMGRAVDQLLEPPIWTRTFTPKRSSFRDRERIQGFAAASKRRQNRPTDI